MRVYCCRVCAKLLTIKANYCSPCYKIHYKAVNNGTNLVDPEFYKKQIKGSFMGADNVCVLL